MTETFKKILVTFGDKRYKRSLARLRSQALTMNMYDEIIAYSPSDFEDDILSTLATHLSPNVRGYGYWSWKPYFILKTLNAQEHDAVIHWMDAGCWLNSAGRDRLQDYFSMAFDHPTGILAFQAENVSLDPKLEFFSLPESRWSKGDLLDHFGVRDNPKIINSNQIEATTFFVRNSAFATRVIQQWMDIHLNSFHLTDDTPSIAPNHINFIEHRHDQSVLSILFKLINVKTISAFETYYPVPDTSKSLQGFSYDWEVLKFSPILAKRDRGISALNKLIHILSKRICRILHLIR